MTPKTKITERMAERREKQITDNAAQFAEALTRTLSRSAFKGKCACGLMLTDRDKEEGRKHHSCPRCGWTGDPLLASHE
jgi:hypothetical protein